MILETSKTLLYLTALEPGPSVLILVVCPTVVTVFLNWWIRLKFGYETLAINNSLASVKYGMVGLAYVMLLTFATITVWDKFSLAQNSVIDEAGAARAMTALLNPSVKEEKAILDELKNYLNAAIVFGWPQMALEREAPESAAALQRMYKAVRALDSSKSGSSQVVSELFKYIDEINKARETRITLSKGIVPPLLWYVLISGAVVTVAFSLFFGNERLNAQLMMNGLTTAIMLSTLVLIVAFDHPFTGAVSVDSKPLQMALDEIK
jgi:hypothetical protein